MKVEFTIPGEPHGKGRPQFSTFNGHITVRTPYKTVVYENLVRLEYQSQCGHARFGDESTLEVSIEAYYAIPQSASKKRKAEMVAGRLRPKKKPDIDNICKSILDSLNNIAYKDDAQIVDVTVHKYYSDEPRVTVTITDGTL